MLPLHENHVDFLSAKQSLSADIEFQSSLPVRGATQEFQFDLRVILISIHAPREGSDAVRMSMGAVMSRFQSTLPVRGATVRTRGCADGG